MNTTESAPKHFFRNFTWKKFLLLTVLVFTIALPVKILVDYLTGDLQPVAQYFSKSFLLDHSITSILYGLAVSVFTEKK